MCSSSVSVAMPGRSTVTNQTSGLGRSPGARRWSSVTVGMEPSLERGLAAAEGPVDHGAVVFVAALAGGEERAGEGCAPAGDFGVGAAGRGPEGSAGVRLSIGVHPLWAAHK